MPAAEKAAAARVGDGRTRGRSGGKTGTTKAALMREARAQNVPGRSRMSKAQLAQAVHA